MAKKYKIIIERDEDSWLFSEVISLPGCHTQAKTMDQLIERTKEAIYAYLKTHSRPISQISRIITPDIPRISALVKKNHNKPDSS